MSNSLKVNYLYSLAGTLAGILFPLITFPYTSRILEADGIGQVGFFTSIISYISLFTSLGIPIYAIREIAKVRDNLTEMNRTAIEILILHTIMTLIAYLIVALFCIYVEKISLDIALFLILSASIFLNTIGCEWFYKGIEDFKYITIRGIVVRIVYVILLFCFVHDKSDVLVYALLTVLGTVGNNVFNFVRLRKYIHIKLVSLEDICVSRHVIPAVRIFALNLVISLYLNLDTVILGFLKDSRSVGYYEAANRVSKLLLGVVQSLQTIMIPRFSYLANENTMDKFYSLCQKVIDFVITISIPFGIGLFVLAPTLIHLFCGSSYEPAIVTLEIISPIIILISLSGIPCFQILYPLGHEKLAILSTATGALANLLICFLFIPSLAHNGAAIATACGEAVVTITMFIYGRKYILIKKWSKHYLNCILAGVAMFSITIFVRIMGLSDWSNIMIIPLVGAISYFVALYLLKDDFSMNLLINSIQKIKNIKCTII